MNFPGAPLDAVYSEEGWLIIEDEAWTEHDWSLLSTMQRRAITGDVPVVGETIKDQYRRQQRITRRRARERRRAA